MDETKIDTVVVSNEEGTIIQITFNSTDETPISRSQLVLILSKLAQQFLDMDKSQTMETLQ